jgi:hypothetical protein
MEIMAAIQHFLLLLLLVVGLVAGLLQPLGVVAVVAEVGLAQAHLG